MDFSWIGDFFKWCARLLPFHLGIGLETHGGVKFVHGKTVKEIKPGRYWYWPLFTTVELIPVKRQPLEIDPMAMTTADDKTVHVTPSVIYEVSDVVKAIVHTYEYDKTATEVAKSAVVNAVFSRKKSQLREDMTDKVPSDLTRETRAALKKYGLHVIEARLSEMAESRVIRTVGDGMRIVPEED